jgi:hypothetical protein
MLKPESNNLRWLFIGMISISVFLIVTVFSGIIPANFSVFFNSDTLDLPYLYKDLFINRNGLRDWNFNPSPNFFPDMLAYFILMFLFNDFMVVSFVYSIVQYLVILGLFSYILKMILPENPKVFATISGILMMMFLYDSVYSGDFLFSFLLLSNDYHNGAFVMTLLCVALTLRYLF